MGLYDVEECAGIKGAKQTDRRASYPAGLGRRRIATARGRTGGGFFDDDKGGEDPNPSIGDLGGPPFSRGGGVNNAKRGGSEKGWGDGWRRWSPMETSVGSRVESSLR